ncbi:MAG: GspE/PulE family protein [Candidatus Doudnabacteria bacterium]
MSAADSTTKSNVAFDSFLLDNGFLSPTQHDKLTSLVNSKFSKEPSQIDYDELGSLLMTEQLLGEEDVAKAKAAFLNLPYVDLSELTIKDEVLDLVPAESRGFYQMAPFEVSGKDLKVAMVNPTNIQALEALEFLGQKSGNQIQIYLTSLTSISPFLETRDIKSVVGEALEDIADKELVDQQKLAKKTPVQETSQTDTITAPTQEQEPIIKIVDVILANAIEAGASDIHIEPSENDVRVRYRIDGILHTSLRLPRNVLSAIVSRIKILSNLKIDETRLPQDGRFHVDMKNRSIDLRVSTLPLMHGEKVVMRILDKSNEVPTLEQLGLRGVALDMVMENIRKTHGVFLITGPTGSGKSTTLYSILTIRNTNEVNIVTLEDPVEYFIEGVNQSQIKPEIGLTFASGLRSILRQDPNIVMVGEIRDEETAELAVHAALTGHLVFSTLHTNNAVGAIPRLMNMGIEQFLLSASVTMIMAQRLVRKLCDDCKETTELTAAVKKEIDQVISSIPDEYFKKIKKDNYSLYKAVGCEKCGNIGYKGRLGIFEVMPMIEELQDIMFAKVPAHKVYEEAIKHKIISMKQDGIIKVLNGETTMEEIMRVTTE